MKNWPLFLVLLLLGLGAFIVLRPQAPSQEDATKTPTASPPQAPVTPEAESASTYPVGEGLARSANTEAGKAALAPFHTLPFTREAAYLRLALVDSLGRGIEGAQATLILHRLGDAQPGIDFQHWNERNTLDVPEDGKLYLAVPSEMPLTCVLKGAFWLQTKRKVEALEAGEVVDLGQIALAPATHVVGKVVNSNGQSLAQARVLLEEANAIMWGDHFRQQKTTANDGSFSFDGVPSGRFKIEVLAQGYAPLTLQAEEISRPGKDYPLELVVQKGKPLTGMVVDEEGRPVPKARVYLLALPQNQWWFNEEPPLPDGEPATTTDAEGHFVVQGWIENASLVLGATADGFGKSYGDSAKPGVPTVIRLPRHYVVQGTLKDGHGKPVAKAKLQLSRQVKKEFGFSQEASAVSTDEQGLFQFDPQPSDTWTLDVTSPLGQLQQTIELGAKTEPLALVLKTQNPLNILVVDEAEHPVPKVNVSLEPMEESAPGDIEFSYGNQVRILRDLGQRKPLRAVTDEDGIARFADVPAQRMTLTASALSFAPYEEAFDVSGQAQEATISLQRGGRLRVRLLDGQGRPVSQVRMQLRKADNGESMPTVNTDGSGRAVWNQLAPGEYQIAYQANEADGWWWSDEEEEEFAPDHPMVHVEAGKTTELKMQIGNLALLHVRVLRNGRSATDVHVRLQEVGDDDSYFDPDNLGLETDGRGEVSLPAVQPGTYNIIVKGRRAAPPTQERIELYAGTQSMEIHLQGGSIRGRLSGPDGPVVGAAVALVSYFAPGTPEAKAASGSITVVSISSGNGKPSLKFGSDREQETNTRSSSLGEYQFVDVPAGEWQVVARAEGFGSWHSQPIIVRDGMEVDMGEYRFYPGAVIYGHDQNWTQPPPSSENTFTWGEAITLYDPDGNMVTMAMLDENGDFRIEDLPEGQFRVEKGAFMSPILDLAAGEQRRVDIPIPASNKETKGNRDS